MKKILDPPVAIVVPLVAPSVNHYIKHTRSGRHYPSAEGLAFKEAIALCARGQRIRGKTYGCEIYVMLGARQKGDIDNFPKCILDGLVDAGVIDSDAKIEVLCIHKKRDIKNPRTEVTVWVRT